MQVVHSLPGSVACVGSLGSIGGSNGETRAQSKSSLPGCRSRDCPFGDFSTSVPHVPGNQDHGKASGDWYLQAPAYTVHAQRHSDSQRKSRSRSSQLLQPGNNCRETRASRGAPCSVLSPERETGLSLVSSTGGGSKEGQEEDGRAKSRTLLRPLRTRGSMTLSEQQIVLDHRDFLHESDSESGSDSDSDKYTDAKQTKRKAVDPGELRVVQNADTEKEKERVSNGSSVVGSQSKVKDNRKRGRFGRGFERANGAVIGVKDMSESVLTSSVAQLTDELEKVVGKGRLGGVPVARIIAKGVSGAVKGGAAASMAESVGINVGGGQIEVAAVRGALTGAVADIVSLFIDPPAQEIGEDAVERGEQAAEELEAALKKPSGGTVIINREEDRLDGTMGKILGVEKKKKPERKKRKSKKGESSDGKTKKGKKGVKDGEKGVKGAQKQVKEEGLDDAKGKKEGSSKSENRVTDVRSEETASEGVQEEGEVWGQMEEREDTAAVSVVGNAVDLGTKAISGAMKGAISGAVKEAANNGFIPHGAAKGAISGAFGDTIASRVDPLAEKSRESIDGRDAKDQSSDGGKKRKTLKKGTMQRKVKSAKEVAETKVFRKEGGEISGKSGGGEARKEDEVVGERETRSGREVRVRSGARLQVVEQKYETMTDGEKTDLVPFPTTEAGRSLLTSEEERGDVAGSAHEEEEVLAAVDESFREGLNAVGDDVIPRGRRSGNDVTDRVTSSSSERVEKGDTEALGDDEPGSSEGESEAGKVTGAQLARPQSKSVDGLRIKKGHWSPDLVFETGFGGSDVVVDDSELAERIEVEDGVGVMIDGGMVVDNPVAEQLSLLEEKGVQLRKQERGFWTEEQQAEAEKTALRKLTRALGGAVKGAATGAMTEMATTGTISGIGAVKGAVGGAVADLAADVADPIVEQVGKDSDSEDEDPESDADVDADVADGELQTTAKATQRT